MWISSLTKYIFCYGHLSALVMIQKKSQTGKFSNQNHYIEQGEKPVETTHKWAAISRIVEGIFIVFIIFAVVIVIMFGCKIIQKDEAYFRQAIH